MKRVRTVLTVIIAVVLMAAAGTYFYFESRGLRKTPAISEMPAPTPQPSIAPSPFQAFDAKNASFPLVAISPGSFLMGSERGSYDEKPLHRVTLTNAFFMGATEVTQAQYRAVMNVSPSYFKGDDLPADSVSWSDAVEFCRKLTEAERKKGNLPDGLVYRLPTEAEWEHCCRAGSTTEFAFGDDEGRLVDYAWFSRNSGNTTHPVGIKKPNAWGLYDLHGNVWEWCYDWYADKYQMGDQTDPMGPATGQFRVLRGGSWPFIAGYCRSAIRFRDPPRLQVHHVLGFRVVVGAPLAQE